MRKELKEVYYPANTTECDPLPGDTIIECCECQDQNCCPALSIIEECLYCSVIHQFCTLISQDCDGLNKECEHYTTIENFDLDG